MCCIPSLHGRASQRTEKVLLSSLFLVSKMSCLSHKRLSTASAIQEYDFHPLATMDTCRTTIYAIRRASFGIPVSHIFGICSQPKMRGVYTSRIITRMTYEQTIGDCAMRKFVTKPMCVNIPVATLAFTYTNAAVTCWEFSCRPFPTRIISTRPINLFPKTIPLRSFHRV